MHFVLKVYKFNYLMKHIKTKCAYVQTLKDWMPDRHNLFILTGWTIYLISSHHRLAITLFYKKFSPVLWAHEISNKIIYH